MTENVCSQQSLTDSPPGLLEETFADSCPGVLFRRLWWLEVLPSRIPSLINVFTTFPCFLPLFLSLHPNVFTSIFLTEYRNSFPDVVDLLYWGICKDLCLQECFRPCSLPLGTWLFSTHLPSGFAMKIFLCTSKRPACLLICLWHECIFLMEIFTLRK